MHSCQVKRKLEGEFGVYKELDDDEMVLSVFQNDYIPVYLFAAENL